LLRLGREQETEPSMPQLLLPSLHLDLATPIHS
jgi:hypothetical protein